MLRPADLFAFVPLVAETLGGWSQETKGGMCSPCLNAGSPPITDVLQWLQCFSGMVGVLSRGYPNMVPELMGYQALNLDAAETLRAWRGPSTIGLIVVRQHNRDTFGGQS